MIKKTITYPDLDGNPVTEDFYFHFTKAEVAKMELRHEGGFSAYLQKIVDTRNGEEIIESFERIITDAIGQRSEDGRRFIKSEKIKSDFLQSEAYSQLFMELITDTEAAAKFVQGLIPKDLLEQVQQMDITDVELPDGEKEDAAPAYIRENREPTKAELMAMDQDELRQAFLWKQSQVK